MAKVKFSAFVSDIRNKSNGSVFSKNRYGSIIRNKVTPVNPQTQAQQQARSSLGNLSSSFRALTLDQIKGWNAAGPNFPFTDIFGDVKHLSGQTLFVKLNANLEKIGQPRVLTAPQPSGFPELPNVVATAIVVGDNLGDLEISTDLEQLPVGFDLVAYATPSISKSISFVKNRFRFLGEAALVDGTASLTALYSGRFPTPLVGDIVHIKVALINTATGQQSIPIIVSTVVV